MNTMLQPSPPKRTFTYEQTVKYEVARDLLNTRRAELSEQIELEEAKALPDASVIAQLESRLLDIAAEIRDLDVTDEAGLDASIAKNRREP